MKNNRGLSTKTMTKRICEREDNTYKETIIYDVLRMFADECQNALLNGERVGIAGVGTIIPNVKTRECFTLPCCNNTEGNPPYTNVRMTRTYSLKQKMDRKLLNNLKEGIYGLEKLPFSEQQMTYLKNGGFISEDAELLDEDRK